MDLLLLLKEYKNIYFLNLSALIFNSKYQNLLGT